MQEDKNYAKEVQILFLLVEYMSHGVKGNPGPSLTFLIYFDFKLCLRILQGAIRPGAFISIYQGSWVFHMTSDAQSPSLKHPQRWS